MLKKELHYKGAAVHYTIYGEGKALMLLHGFGEDASVWERQVKGMEGYKVITPELPGTGNSGIIQDMSMEGMAAAVHAIAEAEGITSMVLLGHSMGGYITLAYAAAYPQGLKGFGLIHSTAYADSEEKKEIRRKGIEFIQRNGGGAFLKTATPNLYATATREKNPELVEQHIISAQRFDDAALVRYYRSMIERPDRTEALREAEVPVLIVGGRCDNAVPLKDVLEQSYIPEVSYIHILENSGHMGMAEEPEMMNAAIKEFTDHCYKHRI
jgi:pimeloyl-ACP methyl ester carboxylesterase